MALEETSFDTGYALGVEAGKREHRIGELTFIATAMQALQNGNSDTNYLLLLNLVKERVKILT